MASSSSETAQSVCIIIAAYNAEATIERAVCSALAEPQTAEIVLVDDASSDATIERARSADDGTGRLKVIALPRNGGPAVARNRGIAESRAPWIAVLDSDDFFVSGRLSHLLSYSSQADFIADDMLRIPERDPESKGERLFFPPIHDPQTISFEAFVRSNLTVRPRGELGFLKPLMRRSFFEAHGLGYREDMRFAEDYELYARSLAHGARILLVPYVGYVSVVRRHSLSGKHTADDLFMLRECDADLSMIAGLSHRDKAMLRKHYLDMDCRLQWLMFIKAIKSRSIRNLVRTFLRPFPVPLYLVKRSAYEVLARSVEYLSNGTVSTNRIGYDLFENKFNNRKNRDNEF
jgi:succinoglycan biosynthesis protein ExoU